MLHEIRMFRKVIVLSVFKYQYTIRLQQLILQNQIRYLRQSLQCIRRVCKDKIKLLMATFDKAKHITANGNATVCIQLLQALADKSMVVAVCFHTDYALTATRYQLQRDAACTGKEVKCHRTLKVITLKIFSLAKSVVGLALNVRGTSKCLPLYSPVIIRISYIFR